jgi:hypothetical protein
VKGGGEGEAYACVCPETRTSTSIWRAMLERESRSPLGTTWCPWMMPMRIGPCVRVVESGKTSVCDGDMLNKSSKNNQSTHLIIIPSYNMHIGRHRPQVIIRLLVAYVPCAQNLLYFSGHKKLFELGRKIVRPVGDVEVADGQDENHLGRGKHNARL